MNETGPIYGVPLLDKLPLGQGVMTQAMPSRNDLERTVERVNTRTAAGFEVLTAHYRKQCSEVARLKELIRRVILGKWSVTELQEAIGELNGNPGDGVTK